MILDRTLSILFKRNVFISFDIKIILFGLRAEKDIEERTKTGMNYNCSEQGVFGTKYIYVLVNEEVFDDSNIAQFVHTSVRRL